MTSTVLAPATASVPMVRAMFPVPMRVMLLMRCALFLFPRCRSVAFVPGPAQGVGRDVSGPTAAPFPALPARLPPVDRDVWTCRHSTAFLMCRSDGGGAAVGDQFQ